MKELWIILITVSACYFGYMWMLSFEPCPVGSTRIAVFNKYDVMTICEER